MNTSFQPRIVVIIPAFRQPGLLGEAVVSALQQSECPNVVIVDDGCPMNETRDVVGCFARAYPDRVYYLRQPNRGPGAARNTGIDFALKAWPDLEAVMFLDADNRIGPDYLARARAALNDAPCEIGWVYPDIDMIGRDESISTRGSFSLLVLLDWNYCDTGCVVRRAVLDAGVRFDANMRAGYEDWDFWLQAAEAGFRGRHLANAGFQYRRRAESANVAAARHHDAIFSQMMHKRRKFLRPRNLLELEKREAPRFAIFLDDETDVRFTSDPAEGTILMPLAEALAQFRAAHAAPGLGHAPPYCCFATTTALSALSYALVLASLFWQAQKLMRSFCEVRIRLNWRPQVEVRLRVLTDVDLVLPGFDPHLIFLPTSTLFDEKTGERCAIEIELPEDCCAPVSPAAVKALKAAVEKLSEVPCSRPGDWRRDVRPSRNDLIGLYRRLCGVGIPLPWMPTHSSRGEIGFVIPIHSFGGVEKVVANQGRILRGLGYRPHLFITHGDSYILTQATRDSFSSVNLLIEPTFDWPDPGHDYFGAQIRDDGRMGAPDTDLDALGCLCGMDLVVHTHSLGAHGLAARLRELGVKTMTALHVFDLDSAGSPIGNPHVALAYEHAYDYFLLISEDLRRWCVAHGVPREKILVVPNAPSYPARDTPADLRMTRAERASGPLRILFLGRLDSQKGLDRLAEIVAATNSASFHWRLIGKSVIGDHDLTSLHLGVDVEPPLHEPKELDAAFDWADVLVATSRFEGAPLTILEARRRGVVIIATKVGAVAEVIGRGSYLIDVGGGEREIVRNFVSILRMLAHDPALLAARRDAVFNDPPPEWKNTMAPLVQALAFESRFFWAIAKASTTSRPPTSISAAATPFCANEKGSNARP